uniref:RRM domain-containing protein n=1 Tax=Brugia pahangi TaxID=6280 RepID=A0A0N4SX85_BRUPA
MDYFPGAVSAFLGIRAVDTKKRKRKKGTESRNDESVVLFKESVTKSHRFELSTGKKKLQPKSAGFNGTDCLTSESVRRESTYIVYLCSKIFGTIKTMKRFLYMKSQKGETIAEEKTRTIFVGNAPLSSTRRGIKKLFSQFGTVESVRLRCFAASNKKNTKKRDIPSGVRSLTFHIIFKGAKSIEAALALNGEKYDGNMLRIVLAQKKKIQLPNNIFVGNLPYDMSENELIAHFETQSQSFIHILTGLLFIVVPSIMKGFQSKNVFFVRIVRDPKTDNSKGFAFVAFKENAAIPLALQLDGSIFKSRPLRVKRVQKKSKVDKESSAFAEKYCETTYWSYAKNVDIRKKVHFDKNIDSISRKKVHKVDKRGVKNSIMT